LASAENKRHASSKGVTGKQTNRSTQRRLTETH
jgi:hypothetical protein